jgi:hypothetical protein
MTRSAGLIRVNRDQLTSPVTGPGRWDSDGRDSGTLTSESARARGEMSSGSARFSSEEAAAAGPSPQRGSPSAVPSSLARSKWRLLVGPVLPTRTWAWVGVAATRLPSRQWKRRLNWQSAHSASGEWGRSPVVCPSRCVDVELTRACCPFLSPGEAYRRLQVGVASIPLGDGARGSVLADRMRVARLACRRVLLFRTAPPSIAGARAAESTPMRGA